MSDESWPMADWEDILTSAEEVATAVGDRAVSGAGGFAPSEPERAVVTDFDFKTEVDRLLLFAAVFAELNLEGIREAIANAHTLGPFVDPTRYRDALYRGDLQAIDALAATARPFRDEARKVIAKAVRL